MFIFRFLDDLGLTPESKLVLIIAWKFKAATQCEFTKDEFTNGMTELGCDSIEKLKARLPQLENELRDNYKFKDFYHFTFNYAKNPGQKGLDLDMAIAYWNIVLKDKFKFLDMWCTFLQVRQFSLFDIYHRFSQLRNITSVQYQKTLGIYYWILLDKLQMI